MFFREKSNFDYWLLYLVNLLQVAVGTVFVRNFAIGLLLLIYFLLAVVVLAAFCIRRHQDRIAEEQEEVERLSRFLVGVSPIAGAPIDGAGSRKPARDASASVAGTANEFAESKKEPCRRDAKAIDCGP